MDDDYVFGILYIDKYIGCVWVGWVGLSYCSGVIQRWSSLKVKRFLRLQTLAFPLELSRGPDSSRKGGCNLLSVRWWSVKTFFFLCLFYIWGEKSISEMICFFTEQSPKSLIGHSKPLWLISRLVSGYLPNTLCIFLLWCFLCTWNVKFTFPFSSPCLFSLSFF